MEDSQVKPPIGIVPKDLWFELIIDENKTIENVGERITQLHNAAQRYRDAKRTPPMEWYLEIQEHCDWLYNNTPERVAMRNFKDAISKALKLEEICDWMEEKLSKFQRKSI